MKIDSVVFHDSDNIFLPLAGSTAIFLPAPDRLLFSPTKIIFDSVLHTTRPAADTF
jgi:hypothetical protein